MGKANVKFNTGLIIAMLLVSIALFYIFSIISLAVSGECGNGVSWSLDSGVLIISGSGAMDNYGEFSPAPWADYADAILSVKIEDGVTHVGDFAFFCLEKIGAVYIAGSVEKIGGWAFYGCSSLEMADICYGVKEIGESAFELCSSLASVRIPSSVTTIRAEAFFRCESLVGITIPASVTLLEPAVFTYCYSLESAAVLANISELPYWTFYGCNKLTSVSLSSSVSDVGVSAFHDCPALGSVSVGNSGEGIKDRLPYTVGDFNANADISPDVEIEYERTETDENGNSVSTSTGYKETENSSIHTELTHTKGNGSQTAEIKINATIENSDGWNEFKDKMVDVMQEREYAAKKETMDIDIYLKGDTDITSKELNVFTNKDAEVSLHTSQGAVWQFKGTDLVEKNLSDSYDLSYKLTKISDLNEEQAEVLGLSGYMLVFDSDLNFKVEVHLPIGKDQARQTAVFFSPEKEGYTRMQATVIDGDGIAHFYLGSVSKETEYLIGINVVDRGLAPGAPENVIIPDELKNEYPAMEQVEQIEYVITGRKSSWGLNFGQVTQILAVVMIGAVIIVGVVVYIVFKMKLKRGYVPDMSYRE